MTSTEQRAWCLLAATLGAYTVWLVTVLPRIDGRPLQKIITSYAPPLPNP